MSNNSPLDSRARVYGKPTTVVAIVGDRPESGVRIALERPRDAEDPPWLYAGEAAIPDATYALEVKVTAEGEVTVVIGDAGIDGPPAPEDLAEKVRLIVRAVYRQAKADSEPPAMRIVRWRGEK